MEPSRTALVALVAAAAALALVAAYATVNSDRSYYAYGDITSANEAVNISVTPFDLPDSKGLSAGGQGMFQVADWIKVTNQSDIENVKLLIRWVNYKQFKPYFEYIKILLNDSTGQIKGYVDLKHPKTIVTIDAEDFGTDGYSMGAIVYYELKEGKMMTDLPFIFNIKLLQSS